ncbi:MAG: amidohydrolase [Bacillota bacterium]|nr:amidohydrolase [Bacillota bacterium]
MMNANTDEQYLEKLKTYRQNLHKIPELGRHLPKTKQYLISVLEQLNCRMTFLCDSGICAFFDKGRTETIAFRGDMDALPIEEATQCTYASTHEGNMHACGHDGHMAMVLTLGEYVNTQDELPYNILLIFQPAEETLGGAEEICKSGILEQYNVKQLFGIHLWPFLEAGKISSRPGAMMPKSSEINIHIHGKAAHGTSPYEGCDALYIGTHLVRNIYIRHAAMAGAIPHFSAGTGDLPHAAKSSPERRTLIHFGKLDSGYARNVVSDYTHILGTIRAFSEEDFKQLLTLIKNNIRESEQSYGCRMEFTSSEGYPPVVNDPTLYKEILPTLNTLDYEELKTPLMISEDFSFYGHYAPAVFFLLGTGTNIPLHSNNFDFDESILMGGFYLYRTLLKQV